MPYSGLNNFISDLEKHSELQRIKAFVDPVFEITEITDRITKNEGKALLFENNGTRFPVLINAYGSEKRMAMALDKKDLDSISPDIISLFEKLSNATGSAKKIFSSLNGLLRIAKVFPSKIRRKGKCQQVIHMDPDLSVFPVLKCWPHDGGRFITLPVVHTVHPVTGKTNAGMYRMQVLDKNTTGMHWQRHKTGANHFEEWKASGKKMPVTVTLGGDPVYAYCASAPLPENIDEYILAGFLRGEKVKLVKCITNDLYIPSDADIVLEGFVDPSEGPVLEGPFGDHTGFYSLADFYPRFHVTCITHSEYAVYPATIVGIPPQEDAWLTKATEKIFLAPVKLALQPEITDFHMPDAGVAHNLVIVKINKSYPGQGKKVINSLFGAGQMMFTKYLIVTSGETDIRNYRDIAGHILKNTDFRTDLLFSSGPLDVLDHSSDVFSMGGKLGIDGTVKMEEEKRNFRAPAEDRSLKDGNRFDTISKTIRESGGLIKITGGDSRIIIVGLNSEMDREVIERTKESFRINNDSSLRLIVAVDNNVDINDLFMVAWQVLGNSDPARDIELISGSTLFIDGTIKAFRKNGFTRKWPNVVCSSEATINKIDSRWESLGLGPFIPSPSSRYLKLVRGDSDCVIPKNI
jgi:4-hydroxy-3-polyprenylbenzoate decarboxylase